MLLIPNLLYVKLPAHRAGLPGNEISFLFVPLDPAYKAGLAGHLPVKIKVCSSPSPSATRLSRKPMKPTLGSLEASPARPVAFRPTLASGLAFH
jgi:hypothetical protein